LVGARGSHTTSNVAVTNCIVHDVGHEGISVYPNWGASGNRVNIAHIRNNVVYNTGQAGGSAHPIDIANDSDNITIEFNYVSGSAIAVVNYGYDPDEYPDNFTIHYNIMNDTDFSTSGYFGFNHFYGSGAFYGNILIDSSIALNGVDYHDKSIKIYNNTVYSPNVTSMYGCAGIYESGSNTSGIEFKNNIFYCSAASRCFYDSGELISQHANNLYYRPSGTALVTTKSKEYTAANIADWEATAKTTNPTFTGGVLPTGFTGSYGTNMRPNTTFFAITSGNALNNGATLASTYNGCINGAGLATPITRPQGAAYDIGAYEYDSGSLSAPLPSNYNLSIVKFGEGSGTVSSSPSGIYCGSSCSYAYSSGATVTLTATPDSGHSFSGWSGGSCSGMGTCVVTMNADTTVTATFAPPPPVGNYSVTVSKSGTGTGSVSSSPSGINCGSTCSKVFSGGTTVTLTATPASSHSFAGWTGGGCSGKGSCIVKVNAHCKVTATFSPPPPPNNYNIVVLKSGTGTGYVSSSPSGIDCGSTCSSTYTRGTRVILAATPDSGYTFVGWSGRDCSGKGTCVSSIFANTTVTATFSTPAAKGLVKLRVIKAGTGMGVLLSSPAGINCGSSCEAEYEESTVVTLTENTTGDHTFVGWSGAGCSGTGTCVVTMNADTTITANFLSSGSSDGGGGSCFIATAAYGSYFDPHVKIFRDFRDVILSKNTIGQAFVEWYYRASPPVADYIRGSEFLKASVRLLLFPEVGFCALALNLGVIPTLMLFILIVTVSFVLVRRVYFRCKLF
jgi:hypothetical protein